jgi:hypothetical protein
MKSAALWRSAKARRSPEWDEGIVIARHEDFITAGCLKLLAQGVSEGEDDVFFDSAVFHGAAVMTAVAGVEHDQRFCASLVEGFGRNGCARHRGLQAACAEADRLGEWGVGEFARGWRLRTDERDDVEAE